MPRSVYHGSQTRARMQFWNAALVLTDPTTITARVQRPSGAEVTYTYPASAQLVRESVGTYYVDLLPASGEAGMWWVRWQGTGAVQQAKEQYFHVRASVFA